jgi:hypothetical protein
MQTNEGLETLKRDDSAALAREKCEAVILKNIEFVPKDSPLRLILSAIVNGHDVDLQNLLIPVSN